MYLESIPSKIFLLLKIRFEQGLQQEPRVELSSEFLEDWEDAEKFSTGAVRTLSQGKEQYGQDVLLLPAWFRHHALDVLNNSPTPGFPILCDSELILFSLPSWSVLVGPLIKIASL